MDWPLTGKETVSPLQNGEAWIDYETKVVHEYHQVWHSVGVLRARYTVLNKMSLQPTSPHKMKTFNRVILLDAKSLQQKG